MALAEAAPCVGRVVDHDVRGVVELVVVDVGERQLVPHASALRGADEPRQVTCVHDEPLRRIQRTEVRGTEPAEEPARDEGPEAREGRRPGKTPWSEGQEGVHRDQKSLRCSMSLSGLYLEYSTPSSVKMPVWPAPISSPRPDSISCSSSSKYPRT